MYCLNLIKFNIVSVPLKDLVKSFLRRMAGFIFESNEFKKWTTSDAANSKNKVVGRIEFVRDCLLGKIDPNTLSYDN